MPAPHLRPRDIKALQRVFRKYPRVKEVFVFGSRATGNADRASDVDVAVNAPTLSAAEWSDIREDLDSLPIILALDVVRLDRLPDSPLRTRIHAEGLRLI